MNEHDELEPTVAIPRVEAPQPPSTTGMRPLPPAPVLRPAYVYGNPVTYVVRRFCAFVLDFTLVCAVATMLLYGLIAVNPFTGLPSNSEGGFDATVAMGAAIALLYVWLAESIFGVTLGKLAFSLHVFVPHNRFVGFGRALIRNLLRPIDLLAIGGLLALLPAHRRLGDLLGGTVVARSPLRAFSPLVGWLLIITLGAVPFFVGGGSVTVLAVAAAFVNFIPPLIAHVVQTFAHLFASSPLRLPGTTG